VVAIPRLVIAAPASGCGKTTVACGLMAALRSRGLVVSGHKVGPDYIDPGYHVLATKRPARNLDPFLCGEDLIAPLFLHGAAGAQVAVIEGVMGLFDGTDPATAPAHSDPDFGSTAHVARLLAAPVVLVVDAARAGRSVAALVAGFAGFDPRTPVSGVILNRVASERHERLLTDALASSGMPVYGAIGRTDAIATPSRHLGLIPAAEREAVAAQAIARMGALITASCDLEALLALARRAPALPAAPWEPAAALAEAAASWEPAARPAEAGTSPHPAARPAEAGASPHPAAPLAKAAKLPAPRQQALAQGPGPVIALAQGPAFTFGYTEQAELLEAAGSRVAPFDPLRDEDLPEGTSGLILGGGFPEVHAPGLSANERLRERVAALARRGVPVAAECAGLLYLARTLDGQPMCGVLDVQATMTEKLTLGYRNAVAMTDSTLARVGDKVRGHEFHRTVAVPAHGDRPAWRLSPERLEGHVNGPVTASYLHMHWAGYPAAAARFAAACRPVPAAKVAAR
jgi:cobyrinic acid a,c-diamide synthase